MIKSLELLFHLYYYSIPVILNAPHAVNFYSRTLNKSRFVQTPNNLSHHAFVTTYFSPISRSKLPRNICVNSWLVLLICSSPLIFSSTRSRFRLHLSFKNPSRRLRLRLEACRSKPNSIRSMASQQYMDKMQLRQNYRNLWHTDLMGTIQADFPCKNEHQNPIPNPSSFFLIWLCYDLLDQVMIVIMLFFLSLCRLLLGALVVSVLPSLRSFSLLWLLELRSLDLNFVDVTCVILGLELDCFKFVLQFFFNFMLVWLWCLMDDLR